MSPRFIIQAVFSALILGVSLWQITTGTNKEWAEKQVTAVLFYWVQAPNLEGKEKKDERQETK